MVIIKGEMILKPRIMELTEDSFYIMQHEKLKFSLPH